MDDYRVLARYCNEEIVLRHLTTCTLNRSNLDTLFVSASRGHCKVVSQWLDNGADVNTKYCFGFTLLHLAAMEGLEAIVQLLLGKGANVDAKDRENLTALHYAAGEGNAALG